VTDMRAWDLQFKCTTCNELQPPGQVGMCSECYEQLKKTTTHNQERSQEDGKEQADG